jgi:L-asparaginase/Glu-tRNA(Gln) amidotransferase subunit D
MSARDLAAELAAEADARELEALRELRDLVLAAFDINGELTRRCMTFDEDGMGPIGTFSPEFSGEITTAAQKAVRR